MVNAMNKNVIETHSIQIVGKSTFSTKIIWAIKKETLNLCTQFLKSLHGQASK